MIRWFLAAAGLWAGVLPAQCATNLPPIRVACFDVAGTGEKGAGARNIHRCLSAERDFNFQTIMAGDIRSNALARFDVLICPGGSGHKQADTLDPEGCRAIRDYVK